MVQHGTATAMTAVNREREKRHMKMHNKIHFSFLLGLVLALGLMAGLGLAAVAETDVETPLTLEAKTAVRRDGSA